MKLSELIDDEDQYDKIRRRDINARGGFLDFVVKISNSEKVTKESIEKIPSLKIEGVTWMNPNYTDSGWAITLNGKLDAPIPMADWEKFHEKLQTEISKIVGLKTRIDIAPEGFYS